MRRVLHHARGRLQLEQPLPCARRAFVLRERLRPRDERAEERDRARKREGHALHDADYSRGRRSGRPKSNNVRIELLTVGESFRDLVFVGLPHLPRSGEELKSERFVETIGGGAAITAVAAARLGLRVAMITGPASEAGREL